MNTRLKNCSDRIKTVLASTAIAALAAISLPTAHAGGVGTLDFGITNASLAASTGTATLAATTPTVSIDQQDNILLIFTGTTRATNASSTTLKFGRVDADGNVESNPQFVWVIANTNSADPASILTNSIVAMTNLNRDLIGGASGLSLLALTNGSAAGALTSPALKANKKRLQAPN